MRQPYLEDRLNAERDRQKRQTVYTTKQSSPSIKLKDKSSQKEARRKKKKKRIAREKEAWEATKKDRERRAKEKSVPQGGQPQYNMRHRYK